jgi:porin
MVILAWSTMVAAARQSLPTFLAIGLVAIAQDAAHSLHAEETFATAVGLVDPHVDAQVAPQADSQLAPSVDAPALDAVPATPSSENPGEVPAPPATVGTFDAVMPAPPPPATLFGGPWDTRPKLTGDWYGVRPDLASKGIAFDGNVTQFYQGITSGGAKQEFRYGGHADYYMNVDGQKAGLWQGLFLTLHAETVFGQSVNGLTGALLPVSFIQAVPKPDEPVTALTAVKITQALSPNFVTYFGKLNPFDDFYQRYASGRGIDAFMNTAFLFNPVLARQIPYSSFGAGAAYLVDGQPVATLTIFDANNNSTSSGFDTFFDNGVVVVGQLIKPTQLFDMPGHQSVGFAYSNAHYRSLDRSAYLDQIVSGSFSTPRQTGSESFFYQFDQTLVTMSDDPTRSWGLFGNAGIADNNPSPIRWFANLGVGGSSPACGRPLDSFGLGYFYLGTSSSLQTLAPVLFPIRDEQGVELYYNYAVTPWFRVTPDLQVVMPAREKTLPPNAQGIDTAVILGIRAKIVF